MKRFLFVLLLLLLVPLVLASCGSFAAPLPSLDGTEPVPDITLPTPEGKILSISDYRDKVVFLNFWGTYCPPCVAELPDLQSVYEKLQEDDFVIIGLNAEEKPEKVQSFVTGNGITFPIIISDDATINPLYQLKHMPTTWFIDKDGILRGKVEGQMSKDTALKIANQLLQE